MRKQTLNPGNFLCLSLFLALLFAPYYAAANQEHEEMLLDQITIKKSDGEEFVLEVEIALTPEQQSRGLMGRSYLSEDSGMLFVFPTLGKRVFWMKNTLIPLDLLFLNEDGSIHHIHHMAKPQDLSRITSERPSIAVLEIVGGLSDRLEISEGDKILHPVFHNVLAD